eukprot:124583_1
MSQKDDASADTTIDPKMDQLQKDLLKMKKLAKSLLQAKQSLESKVKSLEESNNNANEQSRQAMSKMSELDTQLEQATTMSISLEDIIEKRNEEIARLIQKLNHADEAASLQNTTSQQILQELNEKCAEYEGIITKINMEKESIQESNQSLIEQIETLSSNPEPKETEPTPTDQRLSFKQLFGTKPKKEDLKTKIEMEQKDKTIDKLIAQNQELQSTLYDFDALQESHAEYEQQLASMKVLLKKMRKENKLLRKNKANTSRQKRENMDEDIKDQNEKIRDLFQKTKGFRDVIKGFKEDVSSITMDFEQEVATSTKSLERVCSDTMECEQTKQLNAENMDQITRYNEHISSLAKQNHELKTQLKQYTDNTKQESSENESDIEVLIHENKTLCQKLDRAIVNEKSAKTELEAQTNKYQELWEKYQQMQQETPKQEEEYAVKIKNMEENIRSYHDTQLDLLKEEIQGKMDHVHTLQIEVDQAREREESLQTQLKDKQDEYDKQIMALKGENEIDIKTLNERNQSLKEQMDKQQRVSQQKHNTLHSQIQKHTDSMDKTKEAMRLKEQEMNEKESAYRAVQEANDTVRAHAKEYEAK